MNLIPVGMIRRMDDLGRIAIPKELRRKLEWHEGNPFELFITEDGKLLVQKYEGELD
jgi:AbrB family looped-hinge helix DNA binding protein